MKFRPFFGMFSLIKHRKIILTDSGSLQIEACFANVHCITLRDEKEWVETVEAGWDVVIGADREKIVEEVRSFKTGNPLPELYEIGRAAERIVEILAENLKTVEAMCR